MEEKTGKAAKLIWLTLASVFSISLILLVSAVVFSIAAVFQASEKLENISEITIPEPEKEKSSYIYSLNPLTGEYDIIYKATPYTGNVCIETDIDTLPDYVKNAFISIEDERFYEHEGIDITATSLAVAKEVLRTAGFINSGEVRGGSTITQQLVKNLTSDDEVSVDRKLREISRAVSLETHYTKEEILDEICATLGGRAAEELFTGRISTGAMNDLEKVTKRAYGMIAYAGMGDKLPNLCYYDNQEYQFNKPYSDKTAETIDEEVRNLISGEYERAKKVLLEHKDGHAQLAQRLIEKEVIFAEDLEEIFGKRPWTSRTDEILAANAEEDQAEDEQSNNATDHKKENEEIIRQKIVQAVIEKAAKAKEAEQNAPDAPADQQSETDKPEEA